MSPGIAVTMLARLLVTTLMGLALTVPAAHADDEEGDPARLEQQLMAFLVNRRPTAADQNPANVVFLPIHAKGQAQSNLVALPQSAAASFYHALLDQGDLENTVLYCRTYSKAAPSDPIPIYCLGRVFELRGQWAEATEQYQRAAASPSYFFADFRLWGIRQFIDHRPDKAAEALTNFEEKLSKMPNAEEQAKLLYKQVVADEMLYDASYHDRASDSRLAIRALQMGLSLVPGGLHGKYLGLARSHLTNPAVTEWIDQQLSATPP